MKLFPLTVLNVIIEAEQGQELVLVDLEFAAFVRFLIFFKRLQDFEDSKLFLLEFYILYTFNSNSCVGITSIWIDLKVVGRSTKLEWIKFYWKRLNISVFFATISFLRLWTIDERKWNLLQQSGSSPEDLHIGSQQNQQKHLSGLLVFREDVNNLFFSNYVPQIYLVTSSFGRSVIYIYQLLVKILERKSTNVNHKNIDFLLPAE